MMVDSHFDESITSDKHSSKKDSIPDCGDDNVADVGHIEIATDPCFDGVTKDSRPRGNLSVSQAAIIFITNEVGIGMLSLPAALRDLGIIPGVIAIVGMDALSLYTAYILVQFYNRYPHVVNIVDYGRVLGGRPLEIIFACAFIIDMALICASAVITMSIGLNTVSEHGACTLVFMTVSVIAFWILCLPRTVKFVAWCGWPCTVATIAAIMVVMIALGVSDPNNAPPEQSITFRLVGDADFTQSVSAYLSIAFAFTGNQAFPTILAEYRNPHRDYPRAIVVEKTVAITLYVLVAVVCYVLAGDYVTSPALGSAPMLTAKVAYGIMFLSLSGTGIVFGHTATKYLNVFVIPQLHKRHRYRTTNKIQPVDPLQTKGAKAWLIWGSLATGYWLFVWVIANAIPVFNSLLNISASVLLTWFTWRFPAVSWFHLNWSRQWSDWKKASLAILNWFIIAMTLFSNTGGLYASIVSLLAVFNDPNNNVNGPFTCADNSIF